MQASKECVQRLQKEFKEIRKSPPDNIIAAPKPDNILEWHFVVLGPSDTPYDGGVYHGRLVFKPTYPHAPPAIYMMTPSGRFDTTKKLCLSMSDYHPETWSPAWSVSSILVGFLSFMLDSEITAGSIETTVDEKVKLAGTSLAYNMRDDTFKELFPMLCFDDSDEEEDDDDDDGDDADDDADEINDDHGEGPNN